MTYRQDFETKRQIGGVKLLYWPGTRLLYLVRFILWRFDRGLAYLHRIVRADPDRHVHNHPWFARCYVLWGGYSELVVCAVTGEQFVRFHRRGDVNELRLDEYHKIVDVEPNTWTLVIGSRRVRRWGFLVDGKHVDADVYLNNV